MEGGSPLATWIDDAARRIEALSEWSQRSIHFALSISDLDPEDAAAAFSRLVAARFGIRDRRSTIAAESAFLAALEGHWPMDHRHRAREAAAGHDDEIALTFLVCDVSIPEDEATFLVPDYEGGRQITLGERRAIATQPSRRTIEKAMLDPHPMVVHKLLGNPKLTEPDVIRMASRRPVPSEILVEIALHPRWRRRRRTALTLVYNSYLSPEIGLTLLPSLPSEEIERIAADGRLSEQIRDAARVLLGSLSERERLLRQIGR